ncbi:MAG TPA: 16S rRNA (uracil(1498)-N(3))-methyltransferase [Desulfatiglandales bacterium]|nr:16S rRNA (uracil(1498)-N(3))-methyltransferase [Desulfatiglandales bacterium]
MRKFFVEEIVRIGDLISITGKESKHIRNVLRMKKGDNLVIMDGREHLFEATLEALYQKEVKIKVTRVLPPQITSPIKIHIAQALIKSHPLDYLIQKLTELGISSLSFFSSERAAVKIKTDHLPRKMERWRKIMISACKQCGRTSLPKLHAPQTFERLVKSAPSENTLKILLWEAENREDLKKLLNFIRPLPNIIAAVGPEGGFTTKEINLARDAGFHIVSLGSRILRSETAAVSLISIIQYEWGDLNLSNGGSTVDHGMGYEGGHL